MSVAQVFGNMLSKPWVSPGATIDALIASTILNPDRPTERRVRSLTGPLGGGKSTGVMGATLVNAMQQPMWPDGIRRYRVLVLRDTYTNAWSQFVPFFEEWWPRNMPGVSYAGSTGGPLDITLHLMTPVGPVDYVLQLRALGEHRSETDVENFLRGLPVTDIWLEEGDILPESVYRKGFTRMGRYPARGVDGIGARSPTLWLSSNQFLIGSWPYKLKFAGEWRPGIELFEQPGGRSPDAENLHNLSEGYYEAIIARSDERTIRRQVDNEHVLPNAGSPVYTEFRDLVHTRRVTLDRNLPLEMGFDGGLLTLSPAGVISQTGMGRQLRFKREIYVDQNCGVDRFATEINTTLGREEFSTWNGDRGSIDAQCDPSAMFGADKKIGQLNWIAAIRAKTGINIKPAHTNDQETRKEALREHMKPTPDGQPGLLVDPEGCPYLRAALGGLYHYPKIKAGMASRDSETPAKNHPYSDVADAAQYRAMSRAIIGIMEGRRQGARRPRRTIQELAETD